MKQNNSSIFDPVSKSDISVGSSATWSPHSDCYPATVCRIVSPKCVEIQNDDWKIISGSEDNGTAEYTYIANTKSPKTKVRLTKRGWRTAGGMRVGFGHRRRYYDPSF